MKLIEITALSNGAHRNQTLNDMTLIPSGWAVIPPYIAIPSTFPFVDIVVNESDNIPIVTSMTPGIVPEVEPVTTVEEPVLEENQESIFQPEVDMAVLEDALCDLDATVISLSMQIDENKDEINSLKQQLKEV